MSNPITCPECNSSALSRDQQEEGFICFNCKFHFPYGPAEEEYKYSLDLADWGFTEIPEWVLNRNYIKELDLSAEPFDEFHAPFVNRISAISPKIRNLKDLEELDLSGNMVSEMPEEIGECRNLRFIYLGRNCIKKIPDAIGKLKQLEALNLRYNLLEFLPQEIGLLTNLRFLNLENNDLRSLPESVVNLVKLEEFRIAGNLNLISPPYNIAMEGLKSIQKWFDQTHNT